jgi:hypothetical protein
MLARLGNGSRLLIFLGVLVAPGFLAAWVFHSIMYALLGPVAMVALLLAIAALPIGRKVTPEQFADELQRHLNGTDNDDDWDQTSSVSISDPVLEKLRRSLSDGFDSLSTPEDRDELRHVIQALRRGEIQDAGGPSDVAVRD